MSKTTIEFLNAIKAKYEITSNYGLARKLDQTDTDIARWMKGKNTLGDEAALKVAEHLDLDPAYVLACVHAERAKSEPEKAIWQRMANMATEHRAIAASLLAVVAVACSLPLIPADQMQYGLIALGIAPASNSGTLYIMSNVLSAYWPLWSALAVAIFFWLSPTIRAPKKEQLPHLPN